VQFLMPAQFDAHSGAVVADTDAATVTFNMDKADKHAVTLGGNRTLAVTGSRTVTWWTGIRWPGGTAPTLTTTAGKEDVFSFLRRAAGDYMGWIVGSGH
jgi:hypothetical protein